MFKRLPIDENGKEIEAFDFTQGPTNLIITSFPKSGKTLTLVDVPGVLIGDLEDGTVDFSTTNRVDMRTFNETGKDGKILPEFIKLQSNGAYIPRGIFETVDELRRVNKMDDYWDLKTRISLARSSEEKRELTGELVSLINSMRYPVFVIDTITSIQEWNNRAALAAYNDSVSPDNRKKDIKKVDNYSGVRYTRRNFDFLKQFIEKNSAPYIIWSGHTGSRKKILEKGQEEISVADIALDGLQSSIFTAHSQANAILYRDDKGVWLDFQKRDESDLGTRTPFLANRKIKIADILKDDDLKNKVRPNTYWSEIYPELSGRFQGKLKPELVGKN